ncbi:MAG: hypothetical protein Q3982_08490, partial [Phoenicibacter congonensis]|nr:hypothetical protein [Phoenicibacter congonensis]
MDIGVNTTLKSNGGKMEVQSGGTWKIASGKSLMLNSGTGNLSFAEGQTVKIVGGGSLALNGGRIINSGSINNEDSGVISFSDGDIYNTGTGSFSFGGRSLELGSAIFNEGTVTFGENTTLIVSAGASIQDFCGYKDKGVVSANGYIDAEKAWLVLNLDNGASITGGKGITMVTIGGTDYNITQNDEGWSIEATLTADPGVYYVNYGVVLYDGSPATGDGGIADATKLQLNGGTLRMTSSLTEQVSQGIGVSKNSTIQLDGTNVALNKSSVTVDTGKTLTLTGNGNYVIDLPFTDDYNTLANTPSLGATLDADWTGTVTLKGGAFKGQSVDDFAKSITNSDGSQSWSTVEFRGLQGYMVNTTINANVKLTNFVDGSTVVEGIKFTNGNSNAIITFAGNVSGTGDVRRVASACNDQNYIVQGDVSQWTGSFINDCIKKTSKLTFSGK